MNHGEARHAVGCPTPHQFLKTRQFGLCRRDDNLSADLESKIVLPAKFNHRSRTGNAVVRLQGAGFVIDAGVDHATVVAGLMTGDRVFLFKNGNTAIGKTASRFQGCRQSNDSTTDDDEIQLQVHGLDNTMTE